jgi:hypothetical protein
MLSAPQPQSEIICELNKIIAEIKKDTNKDKRKDLGQRLRELRQRYDLKYPSERNRNQYGPQGTISSEGDVIAKICKENDLPSDFDLLDLDYLKNYLTAREIMVSERVDAKVTKDREILAQALAFHKESDIQPVIRCLIQKAAFVTKGNNISAFEQSYFKQLVQKAGMNCEYVKELRGLMEQFGFMDTEEFNNILQAPLWQEIDPHIKAWIRSSTSIIRKKITQDGVETRIKRDMTDEERRSIISDEYYVNVLVHEYEYASTKISNELETFAVIQLARVPNVKTILSNKPDIVNKIDQFKAQKNITIDARANSTNKTKQPQKLQKPQKPEEIQEPHAAHEENKQDKHKKRR